MITLVFDTLTGKGTAPKIHYMLRKNNVLGRLEFSVFPHHGLIAVGVGDAYESVLEKLRKTYPGVIHKGNFLGPEKKIKKSS